MIEIFFNGSTVSITSLEQLKEALNGFDAVPEFELWISIESGPMMCMLRNAQNAWLMYQKNEDDSVRSAGKYRGDEVCKFRLANGQVDEYPLSWCIDVEQCYQAITYFYVNRGDAPAWLEWE
ncbi:hypothetical protein [Massilia sp. YIM B04103]|uniref:hypothetical protein n=1 Tax=Massilia sp. YIM B04103 TaxID=2963106 RepID=UPI00210C7260|nr:hypothetical protein [Massilia sp. YIM B04103]